VRNACRGTTSTRPRRHAFERAAARGTAGGRDARGEYRRSAAARESRGLRAGCVGLGAVVALRHREVREIAVVVNRSEDRLSRTYARRNHHGQRLARETLTPSALPRREHVYAFPRSPARVHRSDRGRSGIRGDCAIAPFGARWSSRLHKQPAHSTSTSVAEGARDQAPSATRRSSRGDTMLSDRRSTSRRSSATASPSGFLEAFRTPRRAARGQGAGDIRCLSSSNETVPIRAARGFW